MSIDSDNRTNELPAHSAGRIDSQRVARLLRGERIGQRFKYFEEIDSTNRFALELPASETQDGLVIVTERQSAGRGRLGRAWHCPRGAGILCTVVLDDPQGAIDANLLSLVVPVALVDGIRDAVDVRAEIRWPNDLVTPRGKLAGVLIESAKHGKRVRYALGFGINCLQHRGHFPEELRNTATSLDLECPTAIDRDAVLTAVLQRLDAWMRQPAWDPQRVRSEWIRHAIPLGGSATLRHDGRIFRGVAIDIDPTAAIVVQLDEGGRRLFAASNTSLLEYRS